MTFAYDIRSNLTMLVDLLNTAGGIAADGDQLTTTAGLRDFAAGHDFSGPLTATKADVEETRRLRERFAAAFAVGLDAEPATEASLDAEPASEANLDSDAASDTGPADESAADALERRIVEEVNLTLRETDALPQLVRHGDWDWHLHAVGATASLADRVAADVALVLIDLIRSGDLDRLGRCAAEDCRAYLADFSRNRSKRFCDTGNCANRTHVAAFRARQSDAGRPSS
ncbi:MULTISPECIES: CGNR zinc finger domain-containing protein [unclassified Brevibacterium]|uniref:CGNR zinc finger domain-containing protein n=1 Tax=unclassified Brevibacterium TaxID=2614124 RepID=UPI00201759E4|nr:MULTISPECIES: CGNR zinc finger domain-containing protein [unclassified Brevibacterium]MCM1011487.1 CGNR zinc finger domain-containing protein [Brevibacterium sp. XM4083]